VLETPLALVATAVRTFSPSTRGTGIEKVPPPWDVEIPLIFTVAFGSLTAPLTVTGVRLETLRLEGKVIVIFGAGA
jgi:hypothetical protein